MAPPWSPGIPSDIAHLYFYFQKISSLLKMLLIHISIVHIFSKNIKWYQTRIMIYWLYLIKTKIDLNCFITICKKSTCPKNQFSHFFRNNLKVKQNCSLKYIFSFSPHLQILWPKSFVSVIHVYMCAKRPIV